MFLRADVVLKSCFVSQIHLPWQIWNVLLLTQPPLSRYWMKYYNYIMFSFQEGFYGKLCQNSNVLLWNFQISACFQVMVFCISYMFVLICFLVQLFVHHSKREIWWNKLGMRRSKSCCQILGSQKDTHVVAAMSRRCPSVRPSVPACHRTRPSLFLSDCPSLFWMIFFLWA